MKKILPLLLVFLMAQTAFADMAPESGKKIVPKNIQIETEKDFPEYNFYAISPSCSKVEWVGISKDNPAVISASDRRGITRFARLLAVPKKNEEMLDNAARRQAICDGKIPGTVVYQYVFDFRADISTRDSQQSVTESYRLEDISPEKGLVLHKVEATPQVAQLITGRTALLPGGTILSLAVIGLGLRRFRKLRGEN